MVTYNIKKKYLQVLAAFIVNIGTINTGLVFGFSAVAIPQLQDANSTLTIDESQASWIGTYIKIISTKNLIYYVCLQQ